MNAKKPLSVLWGLALLIALLLHVRTKYVNGISLLDMLWACHIATLLIAISVFLRLPWLAAVGLLFHLGMGIPAYLIDAFATWTTTLTSVVIHLLPGLVAFWVVRQGGYPPETFWRTLLFVLSSQVIAFLFTPPALNVNMFFAPWPPLAAWFPNVWWYRLFNYSLACAMLAPAHLLLRRLLPSP